MMPTKAVTTRIAGNVVGGDNTVPLFVAINFLSNLNNFSGNFVAKDQGCPLDTIPLHYIAAADATRLYPNEHFTRAYPGNGNLLYPDIPVIVIHGNSHLLSPPYQN
jgi:hypothetical protein